MTEHKLALEEEEGECTREEGGCSMAGDRSSYSGEHRWVDREEVVAPGDRGIRVVQVVPLVPLVPYIR